VHVFSSLNDDEQSCMNDDVTPFCFFLALRNNETGELLKMLHLSTQLLTFTLRNILIETATLIM